jgi:hypothetical protein
MTIHGSKMLFHFAAACVLTTALSASLFSAPCARSSAQQNAWVANQVTALVQSARAAYEDKDRHDYYQRVVDSIAANLGRCRLTADADFAGRYPEFIEYIRLQSLAGKDDHELGFEVSDKQYFAETNQYTTIPDFLRTPDFLKSVSRWETLGSAKALLREMNKARGPNGQLLFFSYASRHLGTPDNPNSYRRLLVIVPGNAAERIPEKWVQFGIADPRKPRTVRNVSVVAVLPRADDTVNVYFKDYFRTYRRNGSIAIKGRWELGEGDDPCAVCHKSGVLPIFPVAGSVAKEDTEMMEAVNDRFLSYGPARFDRYLDPTKFGPSVGSMRGEHFRGAPLGDRFKTRNCSSCHHQNGLNALSWPMDATIIRSFVTGGEMPLNAQLSPAARTQLYNELISDYFAVDKAQPGILQAWLLGTMRPTGDAHLGT